GVLHRRERPRTHPRGDGRRGGRIHHETLRRRHHRLEVRRGGAAMTPEDRDLVSRLCAARAGVRVDPEKAYFIETRLTPLARREGFATTEALIGELREKREERLIWALVEAMVFNETCFFRDGAPFDLLVDEVLPALVKARG